MVYAHKGDIDHAISDYDKALRLNPSLANALHDRGNAYVLKSDYDRAIEDYDQALRINPTYVKALSNRRLAYAQNGEYLRAADHAHYLWLKYGSVTIRLCLLILSIGISIKHIFKWLENALGGASTHPQWTYRIIGN